MCVRNCVDLCVNGVEFNMMLSFQFFHSEFKNHKKIMTVTNMCDRPLPNHCYLEILFELLTVPLHFIQKLVRTTDRKQNEQM